jgi:hypothetical protein
MFGYKDKAKEPKPLAERKCPLPYATAAGAYAVPCMQQECAWWDDEGCCCAVASLLRATREPS